MLGSKKAYLPSMLPFSVCVVVYFNKSTARPKIFTLESKVKVANVSTRGT